ncbi:GNAT family N-acetyltransferase [Methylosinus sp. Sm6]|uniref:GNAT family N-acetyltransferase n=1 Tax=Methylosinus sp. Sm6 TaxID=2866948 RepID=UPI001C991AD4|nr:GNAT family N-acetyltransferase [Methylosinus sp. Sm6]MBY6239738.1 GNAT family N-acetyltransferase [Methylosinus sp. Sm6]
MLFDTDSPRALLSSRLDTLYVTDSRSRLLRSNEWDSRPAPRFHLMRTPAGPLFRCRADMPDCMVARLGELCRNEAPGEAPSERPGREAVYLDLLGHKAPVTQIWTGPVYRADAVPPPPRSPVAIHEGNAELLRPLFPDWLPDVPHRRPFLAVVEGDRAVAICASVRISDAVHCAGVETHPDHRRDGHAATVVAGWAQAVRALGAVPFYSTAWTNIASRAVAARLGLPLVATDFHVG